jgi:cytochrome c oxidase subunit 2
MNEPRHEPAPESRHEPGGDAPPANDAPPQETLHVDRFEGAWMRIAVAVLAIFFISILVSAFASGFQVPGVYQRIDPTKLYEPGSPFAEPGLRELAPGKYEAYIRAQIWSFTPNEIRIPAGSEVTFYATSQDVQHGIKIQDTNINMMILPGQVSTLKAKFDTPGTYDFVCHEYCGQLHHTMYGQLIVEAEQVAAQ